MPEQVKQSNSQKVVRREQAPLPSGAREIIAD